MTVKNMGQRLVLTTTTKQEWYSWNPLYRACNSAEGNHQEAQGMCPEEWGRRCNGLL